VARHAVLPAESPTDPESDRIVKALAAHRWNRNRAAQALGLSRSTLWRRMRDLGIE
jgi:transcriptional regulator of acetoin/glycerol metabolism